MIEYKKLSIEEIVKLLLENDDEYYNTGNPILTDNEYDEIKDYLKKIDKTNPYLKRIGAEIKSKDKVKLPVFLGSQNKIKDDDVKAYNKWISEYNKPSSYNISYKLDGISCLITYSANGKDINLYTRGDGEYGQKITRFKNYIKNIPKKLSFDNKSYVGIRGELIINKGNWKKIKETDDKASNARNYVAGLINSKKINKDVISNYLEFIAYDFIDLNNHHQRMPINDIYELLEKLKFSVVGNIKTNKIDIDYLLSKLKEFKSNSIYEIDGIIITHNSNHIYDYNENPKFSFAFKSLKIQEEIVVIVKDIEWNVSKDKYLKPIIIFDEIYINNVNIKKATGFNADYIVKNKINVGSKIKIVRSGDVIPYIKEVITQSKTPLLPSVPYIWKGKDILLSGDSKNREQDIKIFTHFMKSLDIKGIGEGIIIKLYDNSFDTLQKIINIKKEDLLKIDGFKEKSSDNLINALLKIKDKNCLDILVASNLLGRGLGERKLKLIFDKYPYICSNQKEGLKLTINDIKNINGYGEISAKLFIENLNKFYEFYNSLNIPIKDDEEDEGDDEGFKGEVKELKGKEKKTKKMNEKYKDKTFVFSGFRNKDLETEIKDNGGDVSSTVSKKTTALIVKDLDKDKETTKIKNAIKFDIPIILYDDFIK